MRLVQFQEAVFSTLQGEGSLVGTPSTFVRLWGCDYSCEWCDTKESWRPGSRWAECDVATVIERIQQLRNRHVVITGGNPLLQGEEVFDLVETLNQRGHHVTLETQGSIYHRVIRNVHLLSLSPKLHDWRWKVLNHFFSRDREVTGVQAVQFKLVVTKVEEVGEAVSHLDILRGKALSCGFSPASTHCFLQPEFSRGRSFVREVMRAVQERQDEMGALDFVRVLPQIHKTAMAVV